MHNFSFDFQINWDLVDVFYMFSFIKNRLAIIAKMEITFKSYYIQIRSKISIKKNLKLKKIQNFQKHGSTNNHAGKSYKTVCISMLTTCIEEICRSWQPVLHITYTIHKSCLFYHASSKEWRSHHLESIQLNLKIVLSNWISEKTPSPFSANCICGN